MSVLAPESFARLRKVVATVEGRPIDLTGPRRPAVASPNQGFWAQITGDESDATSGPTGYSWKALQSDGAGGLEDALDAATGTGTAFEAGSADTATGDRVWLRFAGFVDDGAGTQVPIYLFTGGGGGPVLTVRISGATSIGDNRWSYTAVEVEPERQGQYKDKAGGFGGTVYNTFEANNSATGVQGSGDNVSDLPVGIEIQPIGVGAVVAAWRVVNCDGVEEVHFAAPNNAGGSCST